MRWGWLILAQLMWCGPVFGQATMADQIAALNAAQTRDRAAQPQVPRVFALQGQRVAQAPPARAARARNHEMQPPMMGLQSPLGWLPPR